jgi:amidohydrolase
MRCHRVNLVLSALLLLVGMPLSAWAESPSQWAEQHVDELLPLYKHLHCHPELSLQEKETSKRLAEELRAVGADVTTGVGGYGVVGILRNGEGKRLLIRTDMDALPVTEQTELPYASKVTTQNPTGSGTVGVMHACGHDLHMTNLVGVARFLAQHKDQWRGTVVLIGQPAEERVLGAKAMLDDGLYTRFGKPDFALALHVAPSPVGQILCHAGYAMANVDSADITVRGAGGHGAYPETTVDPIVQAAELILALQTIVSREVPPIEPAVVTVGSIHGGTKHNIIPSQCHLQLTIRSYSPKVRQQLRTAIERKAKGVAAAAGAPEPIVRFSEGTQAVYNDPALVEQVMTAIRRELGAARAEDAPPVMGAEDFGAYAQGGVPICMFWLGSVAEDRLKELGRPLSLHSPIFYPDPRPTLVTGISALSAAALDLLEKPTDAQGD